MVVCIMCVHCVSTRNVISTLAGPLATESHDDYIVTIRRLLCIMCVHCVSTRNVISVVSTCVVTKQFGCAGTSYTVCIL